MDTIVRRLHQNWWLVLLQGVLSVVLGVLARRQFGGQKATQADPGQLAGALQQEAQTAQRQSPHVGGILGSLLGAVESR